MKNTEVKIKPDCVHQAEANSKSRRLVVTLIYR